MYYSFLFLQQTSVVLTGELLEKKYRSNKSFPMKMKETGEINSIAKTGLLELDMGDRFFLAHNLTTKSSTLIWQAGT